MIQGYICDFCGDAISPDHKFWEISLSIPGKTGGKTFEACDECLSILRSLPANKNLRALRTANANSQQHSTATPEAKE